MNFACELMDLCRGTQEVEAVLSESDEGTQRDPLARLKMAIRYQEKKVQRSFYGYQNMIGDNPYFRFARNEHTLISLQFE